MLIDGQTGKCIQISHEFPSTLYFDQNQVVNTPPKFILVGYSSENCNDDTLVKKVIFYSNVPVRLNERTPICSFKLGKNPTWEPLTNVVFNNGESLYASRRFINGRECTNLCDNNHRNERNQYPVSVQIYHGIDSSKIVANNFLQFYSENNCLGDPLVKQNKNGTSEVRDKDDLLDLTHKQNDKAFRIKSFIIVNHLNSVTRY